MQYTHTKAQNLNRAFFSKRPEITLDVGKTMSDVEKIISDIIKLHQTFFAVRKHLKNNSLQNHILIK